MKPSAVLETIAGLSTCRGILLPLAETARADIGSNTRLARAPIDECYCGIGDPDNTTRYEADFEEALGPNQDRSGIVDDQ